MNGELTTTRTKVTMSPGLQALESGCYTEDIAFATIHREVRTSILPPHKDESAPFMQSLAEITPTT